MEIFKPIKEFEGIYEVSNLGRVKSLQRTKKTKWGGFSKQKESIKSLKKNKYGYVNIILSKNSKRYYKSVHRLVALAFIPNPVDKPQVNHKNGIKDDNRLSNLEWVTRSENAQHAKISGLAYFGDERSQNAKMSNKDVIDARMLNRLGYKRRVLYEYYNISKAAMQRILTYKTFKEV